MFKILEIIKIVKALCNDSFDHQHKCSQKKLLENKIKISKKSLHSNKLACRENFTSLSHFYSLVQLQILLSIIDNSYYRNFIIDLTGTI